MDRELRVQLRLPSFWDDCSVLTRLWLFSVNAFMAYLRTFGQQEVLFVQTVVKSDKTTLKSAEIEKLIH